ncbi:hypothetical protein GOARA_056_00340 [Gordonia araii NBRC 100433]|uniref:Integral membrane protein n=1 Tax=Gordonia araii NBRC 100433 TaxID=1073574 RepID=G7H362_9ACTN|nr:hypothetical protein [Gordonia araii]NNG96405.1 hypothetical protein [Gordonia araii NBRC 100433]GAB10287.1 hypothetical protein GOARA_056_00340 [Gordonia araii NBRC 100433]
MPASAVATTVLGGIGALAAVYVAGFDISQLRGGEPTVLPSATLTVVRIVAELTAFALLAAGVILMARRKPAGRLLVVAGCAVTIVVAVVSVAVLLIVGPEDDRPLFVAYLYWDVVMIVVTALMPAILTLVLAAAPSTKRWLIAPQN